MRRHLLWLFGAGAMLFAAGPAGACTVTLSTIPFGTYVRVADSETTGSITVDCALGAAYEIQISAGTGTYASRALQGSSGGTLAYNLYTQPNYLQVWGDGIAAGTVAMTGTGTGAPQVVTVYGLIPAGQEPEPGSYLDTIVITVNF